MSKKIISIGLILIGLVGLGLVYQKYQVFYGPNVPQTLESEFAYIPTGTTFRQLPRLLYQSGFLKDTATFLETAKWMKYDQSKVRAGRFKITPGWSNQALIRHLRSGQQAPVKVILTTARVLEDVAQKAGKFIEADSAALMAVFEDTSYLKTLGYSPETLMSLFIPNTYEFFWNTSGKAFLERMVKEHDKFWSKNGRLDKARALNMTTVEVYTLASIIEKETNQNSEKKRMAGVYLNRLKKGMLLQADPTCVFATRDFLATRVTDYHTTFDSPYNTYLYTGLPPGPIAMASIASIDAVLNAENHNYLFFCAKGDGTGLHAFAKTLRGHNQNVARYKRNLRQRGLR